MIKKVILIFFIIMGLLFVPAYMIYWDYGDNYPGSYTLRVSGTKMGLMRLRGMVKEYFQSNGRYPDDLKAFIDKDNKYKTAEIITSYDGVDEVSLELNGKGGWYYDKQTGQVKVNLTRPVGDYFRPWFYQNGNQKPSDW